MIRSVPAFAARQPWLTGLFVVYLVGFGAYGFATGAQLTLSYVVIVGLLGLAVAVLDGRFELGGPVCWMLGAWGVAHLAGGIVELDDGRILYNTSYGWEFLQYDRLVHAVGFGTATVAMGRILRHSLARRGLSVVVIVLLAGLGVGAVNEVFEFLATKILDDTNVGGFDNTGWDLVFNTVGATVAAFWWRRHPDP